MALRFLTVLALVSILAPMEADTQTCSDFSCRQPKNIMPDVIYLPTPRLDHPQPCPEGYTYVVEEPFHKCVRVDAPK